MRMCCDLLQQERGDLLVWDELGGVLHSGSDFKFPTMQGRRVLRKLPPGGATSRRRTRSKNRVMRPGSPES